MLDPRLLYDFDPELWESVRGTEPALIHLLDGYIDAGSVTHGAGRYLLEVCEHEVLVEFDHDQLHDYRSRRPQMIFDTNQWVGMTDYALVIHRLLDANGTPFLLLTGPEPDTQWNRAATAVLGIAERLGVSRLITLSGVPMAVPAHPSHAGDGARHRAGDDQRQPDVDRPRPASGQLLPRAGVPRR